LGAEIETVEVTVDARSEWLKLEAL